MLGSWKNKIVAPELLKERANINFDTAEMKRLFRSEEEITKLSEKVMEDIENDDQMALTHKYYEMTREEIHLMWMKKINHIWFNKDREFYFQKGSTNNFHWFYLHHGQIPIGMHATMFQTSIETFCNSSQLKKWLPLTRDLDIIGCYAQTEMGHGSDVSGLETTATFDQKSDEFVINTPSVTATKWWPGDMGRFANHALVFARLIIEDEGTKNDYGVMPFIVQIRDRDTHKHMPGIQCGDMGPKFGYNSKDNGWMTLNNVRIPRENMPMRFVSVDREGTFSIEADTRLIYSTMLKTRMQLASAGKWVSLLTLTIGLRYSAVRRQFKNISGQKEETVLLDYQTQQQKLFPIMAGMYAQGFAIDAVNKSYEQLLEGIKKEDFSLLDLMHHFTSGMKSVFTQDCWEGLLTVRQSLGGAGYTAWSGIPRIIEDYSPLVTFEGDNTVMAQQSFNYLKKLAKKPELATGVFSYVRELNTLKNLRCSGDFMNLQNIEQALRVNVGVQLKSILDKQKDTKASKKDFVNSLYALDIVKCAQDHVRYITFLFFMQRISQGDIKCPKNLNIMQKFCMLYGLNQLLNSNTCYQCGYFKGDVNSKILESIKEINREMRPYVIGIIESAEVSDALLQSAVGNSYGDIYETHFEWAKNSRLNQTPDAIPEGFMKYMMPVLKGKM